MRPTRPRQRNAGSSYGLRERPAPGRPRRRREQREADEALSRREPPPEDEGALPRRPEELEGRRRRHVLRLLLGRQVLEVGLVGRARVVRPEGGYGSQDDGAPRVDQAKEVEQVFQPVRITRWRRLL